MPITVTIDDTLYKQALEVADPGLDNPSDLLQEALKIYVRVQAGRRLAAPGGATPSMQDIPRHHEGPTEQ